MRRNELPDTCLSTLPSTGQLVVLKHGVRGYYRSEWDTGNRAENRDIADSHNRRRGITDIQETAMMAGSMFGWDTPGAEPQWYLDNARYRNATTAKGHIKDPVMSIYYPVDDFLLRYEVMGKEKLYLPVSALPRELLGARSQFVMQPDLVCGVPAMPVKAQQAQNGSYTMELESGSYVIGEIINADYRLRRGCAWETPNLLWANTRKRLPRLLPGSAIARTTKMGRPTSSGDITEQTVRR